MLVGAEFVDGIGFSFGLGFEPGKVCIPIEIGGVVGVFVFWTAERVGDGGLAWSGNNDSDTAARFSQGPTDAAMEFAGFQLDCFYVRQHCLTGARHANF